MKRMMTIAAHAAGLLAVAPAGASALVGDRVRVCADRLELNREPNQGWDGVLREGQSIEVRKLSASGKYAYGFAYGHINRLGWVRTAGLCEGDGVAARLVGERVPVVVDHLRVATTPAGRTTGSLEPPETFRVHRLSPSGKYAYGFAYGEANRHGWVLTSGLAGGAGA